MLRLREPGLALWQGFQNGSGGLVPADDAARAVLPRWRRAASLRLPADGPAHADGDGGADLIERRERLSSLIAEGAALIEPMTEELTSRGMMALLCDADGVIVMARGGGHFGQLGFGAASVRLVEGARWNEDTRGTNAIGTALAESRSVAVIGSAHYERLNHGLFCYASPVRGAYGELVGVLDVTGALEQDSPTVGVAVESVAAAIERSLRMREYSAATAGGYLVIEGMLRRCGVAALCIERGGVVRGANNKAERLLAGGRSLVGLRVDRLVGATWESLSRVLGRTGHVEYDGQRLRVEMEPVVGPSGRLLSMLVYLEPEPAAPPRPVPAASPTTFAANPSPRQKFAASATRAPAPAAASAPSPFDPFRKIFGDDPALLAAKTLVNRFAPTSLPILLLAETGTGKELMARAIHLASPRAARPFVALNCGALSPSLLESELFGYAAGAFTGAQRGGSDGKLSQAEGGTLLLDEIAEMPEPLQALLLRVVEDGTYYRVGESRPRRIDFRLITATCRDLPARVAEGRFRKDLFYRIQGAVISLPPLRARTDRATLATLLLADLAASSGVPCPALSDEAKRWIEAHEWPGNVRELKSALAHALVLSTGPNASNASNGYIGMESRPIIHAEAFPRPLIASVVSNANPAPATPPARARPSTRDEILAAAVEEAMLACGGNVSEAARKLGVARTTVYRALRR